METVTDLDRHDLDRRAIVSDKEAFLFLDCREEVRLALRLGLM